MSNFKLKKEMTVSLSNTGEVLWSAQTTYLGGGELNLRNANAEIIIIGDKVTTPTMPASAIFHGLSALRKLYVYNQDMYNFAKNHYKNTSVEVELVEDITTLNSLFNYYDKDLFINTSDILNVSDFVTSYSSTTDDTAVINNAIEFVVNNGGKLIFDGDKTYVITSAIKICPPPKGDSNPDVRNFDIDFKGCQIVIKTDSNGTSAFNLNVDDIYKSMIYVNAGFPYEERIGIIRNVTLEAGYNNSDGKKVSCVKYGMYLHASSHIKYEGITIRDAQRGIYVAKGYEYSPTVINSTIEVFMDDIEISKSIDSNGMIYNEEMPVFDKGDFDVKDYYGSSTDIGFECNATDCHFSNIRVYDYVVGFKMIGGDNRIRNSLVTNNHSENQFRYSVGYFNENGNFYINCIVENFHIGWFSNKANPFFLTECTLDASNMPSDSYQFYIPFTDYSGGGIYADDCTAIGEQNLLCNISNSNININTNRSETNEIQ